MSHEIFGEMANTTITPEESRHLAEEINKDMTSVVLPVTIFVGIEAVFAFFGNLLIIYVFVFKYHICNFKYFVLCLSAVDIISSVTTLPGEIVTQTHWYIYPEPIICKIKSFFNVFTVMSSALCLLVIAVDRFRKVCRPFGWQIKPRVAMILCLVILSISLVFAFPVAILWGTHDEIVTYKSKQVTVTLCEIDNRYMHSNAPLNYSLSVSATIAVTLVVMVVLYVFIVRVLFKKKLSKPDDPAKQSQRQAKPSKTIELPEVPTLDAQPSDYVGYACSSADEFTTRSGTTENSNNSLQTNDNRGVSPKPHVKRKRYPAKSTTERNAIVQRKTIIMLVLTMVFIITSIMYLTLLSLIANDILDGMSNSGKTAYFFFFRLYFINHAVNPWVYGFLDPQFRKVVKNLKSAIITIISFAVRNSTE